MMQMLRQACEKARQRMSARAGRLRGCARCWPKRGRAGGRADRCQAMHVILAACTQESGRAGVPHIARNRPVHRLLRQEDEAAPERFPGRATVSHGRPQLGGRKFAGARGSTCADPEDQQAENGIEIIEIHRAGRTEGLAPVGGRPPLLAASEPLFQYS